MKKIYKLLIANRGEIAVRIIQSAKELGIITVSVYAEIDRAALHVRRADEVYALKHNSIEPYLDIDQILDIAREAEVDAIHPGYGFLSENDVFAKRVIDHGFLFIGPSPTAIKLMGDKLRAKEIARKVGIPIIPGFEITDEKDPDLSQKAHDIGFPVLIKATAGGGGKGMRIVHSPNQLNENLGQSIREAKEAFGDGRVFIEKLIEKPRHIEIQIFADNHGNAVHLFERECSIQRRHQKVIEEAPSSVLTDQMRSEMGKAAISLVKACNYTNAGTIEFILDDQKRFYFLEMNTRLQVEHPVTEFITGLDLVKHQIWVAEGQPLSFSQSDLSINGHAVELRIYAEDPQNLFLPDIGILKRYNPPKGIGVRVDDGYDVGMEIPLEYDPLIAKLICYGANRDEAISRMKRAISEYEIEGVKNTLDFGSFVMHDENFCSGDYDTSFISKMSDNTNKREGDATESMLAAVLSYKYLDRSQKVKLQNTPTIRNSRWQKRMK